MSLRLAQFFGVVGLYGPPEYGLRQFGVPPGGPFDFDSFTLATSVTGSRRGWELSMAQARFVAESTGVVAAIGASASVRIGAEQLDTGCLFRVAEGEEFWVDSPRRGARVYVAFGDTSLPPGWRARIEPIEAETGPLRVIAGPQASKFDPTLLNGRFEVTRTGNRVGLRLSPTIGNHSIELPSEPQCVGTIQVSNDGTLILLGPDGPTIGGYPKVAVVATVDIPCVAQLAPGENVRFEVISIEEARRLALSSRAALERRCRILRLNLAAD